MILLIPLNAPVPRCTRCHVVLTMRQPNQIEYVMCPDCAHFQVWDYWFIRDLYPTEVEKIKKVHGAVDAIRKQQEEIALKVGAYG